ncbi:MAG TPA: hypothetical protein VIW29_10535 [Polyangiaceae bacterium]
MRRVLAALLIALGALGPSAAFAEGEPAANAGEQRDFIVLLLPPEETPTTRRLKAEISELDLAVHVAQTDEPVDPDEPRMAELARLFGGEALVLLAPDGRSATIWFSEAQQGERLKRVVQAESGSADLRSESVVVGTVELLRVRLLSRRPAPAPPAPMPTPTPTPTPPAPPPAPAPAPERRPLAMGAAVGLDKAGSKLSFGSSFQLSLDLQLAKPLALTALVRLPATNSQVTVGSATAELSAILTAGGVSLGFNPARVLRLDAFLGAGAAHVVAEGFSPNVPAETSQKSRWVFIGSGGARAAFQIAPMLAVAAQANLALSGVPVEIVLNDQVAAVWGRPVLFFGIGLEVRPAF